MRYMMRRLNRRDYELMIISRLLIYGSVDDERSVLEVSLALSLAYQDRCLVYMFEEVLKRTELPVW